MKQLNLRLLAFAFFSFFFLQNAGAQDHLSVAKAFIQEKATELGLSKRQASEPMLSSSHQSEDIGVTHFYFQQHFERIPVNKAVLNVHVGKDNKVFTYGSTFVPDIEARITSSRPSLSSREALNAVVIAMGYESTQALALKETIGGPTREVLFDKGNISLEDIPVKLVYQPMADGSVKLAWDILIEEPGGQNYWSIRVDAATGAILDKDNLVIHCNFGDVPHTHRANSTAPYHIEQVMEAAAPAVGGGSYRVFREPLESPSHGGRTLVSDPADAIASPFGWHDTNGVAGPEFTITRGNNVHAGLDLSAPNGIDAGSEPNGGAGLVFDFPLNLNLAPDTYRPAAVTNLFYWNNLVHDFSYKYGFTEAAGNFQVNNYGRGGAANDDVRAEAQDYSGTNNANFATPADGQRPRMQMFVWNQGVSSVTVNPPSPFAMYNAGNAGFGPLNFNLSGDLELANPLEACSPLVGFTPGKIAVIDRGTCPFVDKVLTAQAAGAIAVIICNNAPGDPISMGGAGAVAIPSLMLSQSDCATLKILMNSGTVNITMDRVLAQYDSDFDNGVIAHEYAHGISNRLTGGRTNVNCLGNEEQMGEGWSDWYGLMMTIKPGDDGAAVRGIGTYVSGQPTTGNGIRPAPYSTDMSINPATYNTIKTVSVPHGVGYVWCSMLWDLTWAMIEDYGYATGFDVAMWLVNDGMKLQPCSPGFVTGRNAILAADQARYGGANQCRIWQVFARRGLGSSATQGSSNSVADGVEAYDIPSVYDADGDGYYICIDDCDDSNAAINPAATEICDGIDNNCNGLIDTSDPSLVDNTPPSVQCSNQTVTFNGQNSIPLVASQLATASDNCGAPSLTLSPNGGVITCLQLGQVVPVTVTATDQSNNMSTCISQITVTGLPCGWIHNSGSVGCGSTVAFAPTTGVWSATATNCYYANPYTNDAVAFAQRTLCGNGTITARVTNIGGTGGWAGVTMRETSVAGAKKVQLMTNLSNFVRAEVRYTTGGQAYPADLFSFQRFWVRINRQGNEFIGFVSSDGSFWIQTFSVLVPMNSCIQVGLVMTNFQQNGTGTATFDNVSTTGSNVPPMVGGIEHRARATPAAWIEQPYDIEVYPNPTSGELNVDLTQYIGRAVRMEVYSLEGKLLRFSEIDEVQTAVERLDLSSFSNGMYLIRVKSEGLPDATKRVAVAR